MARRYDRYGYNRQFKAKPCSKRYPFPYPLPFVDDYSAPNVLEKAAAVTAFTPGYPGSHHVFPNEQFENNKRSRAYIEQSQRKRRATNAARQLQFPDPLGRDVYSWTRKDTQLCLMAAAAPFAPLAFETLQMVGARSAVARARRIPNKKFIRGKVPDAIRTGIRRGKKIFTFLRSQKPGPRLMRAGVRYASKKLL